MCIGTENSHFQCGHMRNLEISQRCENALASGRNCNKDQCSFLGLRLVNPPLCSPCYRMREEEIQDVWRQKRDEILPDLIKEKSALENATLTPLERFLQERRIEKGENSLRQIHEECNSALAEFRETQRLWAGGKWFLSFNFCKKRWVTKWGARIWLAMETRKIRLEKKKKNAMNQKTCARLSDLLQCKNVLKLYLSKTPPIMT